jgi:cytochrome c-type biogenesis protein CcmH
MFSEISEELICQCGCNLVLGQCGHINCPSAIPMREKIEEMLLNKTSKAEIMNFFMKDYTFRGKGPFGKAILSQPATEGFDLMAWVMPFFLLAVFTAIVFVVVKKATVKKQPAKDESSSEPASDMDRRIEDELKKLE